MSKTANKKRLIYAEDAMKWIRESKVPETGAFTKGINKGLNIALSTLGNNEVLPDVDAVPVVHGRWIKTLVPDGYVQKASRMRKQCSVCGWTNACSYHYCPNCGAKMDGVQIE